MSTPIRWGFLGAGFVATKGMAPAVHEARGAELQVVGSQEESRARPLGSVRVVQGYQRVIEAEDVDAVYISLSNEQHMPWVLKALDAGKHVLCEKPLSVSRTDTLTMLAKARTSERLLVEGLWGRWHPRFTALRDGFAHDRWGGPREVSAGFTFGGVPADNYRLDPERGGGAWWDVGVYPLDLLLAITAANGTDADVEVEQVVRRTGPTGVDLDTTVDLRVGATTAKVTTSIDGVEAQWLSIGTDRGTLGVSSGQPFTSWRSPTDLVFTPHVGAPMITTFPAIDPYIAMIEDVSTAIASGAGSSALPTPEHMQRLADAMDAVARHR